MVKIVVGMMGSSVQGGSKSLSTPQQTSDFLSMVASHNVSELDTARVYAGGKSEGLLGAVHASSTFAISTKAPAFSAGSLAHSKIIANCNASLAALKQDRVDIYYLHGPDAQTPLEEQCDAINQLYTEGKFSRFGVSNIAPSAVRTIHDYCKTKGYVLPSVYQGGYNPILRTTEEHLFPLLRELGMVFYAYSPLAGGLFAKELSEIRAPEKGTRYDEMKVFGMLYLGDEEALKALERLTGLVEGEGMEMVDATMRWHVNHSILGDGDAVILGGSSIEQVERTLRACEMGALSEELQAGFEELWQVAKKKAPPFIY